ncbi:hypothetical protein SAMN05444164_1811 [Bradyrhizobium erythrophlei]|uniref:Uncharacterized protein n=2 Tax=Bradyrhizobium erythrophlei TaxID=1437360 RepID=A0A1H4SF32_9BRAD|nr:hypothetical protein SAMN05444164_1811 [Bradyrhizobium erythrophlei]
MDPPHHTKMGPHVHIMFRGDDVAVVNRDGTPSHNTTTDQVPRWVMDHIKKQGLVESLVTASSAQLPSIPSDLLDRVRIRVLVLDLLAGYAEQRRQAFEARFVPPKRRG